MEMDALRCFLAVARCKSFTRAAEEMFISASTVSRRIAALENELGKSLFRRSSVEIELTEAGQRLLPKVEKTLELYDALLGSLDE